jgi:hypothetical protein
MQREQPVSETMKIAGGLSQCRLDNDEGAIGMETPKQRLNELNLSLNGIVRAAVQLVEGVGDDDYMIGIRVIEAPQPGISFEVGMNTVETSMLRGADTTVRIPQALCLIKGSSHAIYSRYLDPSLPAGRSLHPIKNGE